MLYRKNIVPLCANQRTLYVGGRQKTKHSLETPFLQEDHITTRITLYLNLTGILYALLLCAPRSSLTFQSTKPRESPAAVFDGTPNRSTGEAPSGNTGWGIRKTLNTVHIGSAGAETTGLLKPVQKQPNTCWQVLIKSAIPLRIPKYRGNYGRRTADRPTKTNEN
jgi:hypothetical protein